MMQKLRYITKFTEIHKKKSCFARLILFKKTNSKKCVLFCVCKRPNNTTYFLDA